MAQQNPLLCGCADKSANPLFIRELLCFPKFGDVRQDRERELLRGKLIKLAYFGGFWFETELTETYLFDFMRCGYDFR